MRNEPAFHAGMEGVLPLSMAQHRQDVWVLNETDLKRAGFFVEIGAFNGVDLSNTWLLEKHFDWTGILVEPNPDHHEAIEGARSARLSRQCVWSETGQVLEFLCTAASELSTLATCEKADSHAITRRQHKRITVETISLFDLLSSYNAPHRIDYMSIDTEGSELDILLPFSFDSYDIGLVSIEHNHTWRQAAIDDLMAAQGYERVFREASKCDAWYRKRGRMSGPTPVEG